VKSVRSIIGLGLWAAAIIAWASPQLHILENGLSVLVEEDHSAPVATVHFFVGTGSVMEEEYLGSGISHLLEHVISEGGTIHRSAEEIQRERAALGNVGNAYTSKAVVGYYVVTSGRDVRQAIDHLADLVFYAQLAPEEIERQKGIILREIARGEDEPERLLYKLFAATMFRVCPEGVPIIGFAESLKALIREDLQKFYQRYYVPGNIVVVIVGAINAAEIMSHIQEKLGPIPARGKHMPVIAAEPPQLAPRRLERTMPHISRAYFMLGYPTVSLFSPDMYALDVASYILTNGDASRLVGKLRDEQGLVDSISSFSVTPPYEAGYFAISGTTGREKLEAAERAILAELQRLHKEPVSQAELLRAKRQKEADLLFARATTQERASQYGLDVLWTGDWQFSARYVENIQRVTSADIQRVARKYFIPAHYNFVALKPSAIQDNSVQAIQTPATTQQPKAPIQQMRLPNGLRLLVQENHAVPIVNIFVAFPGGLLYESAENVGITQLMAQMLVRGTRTRSRLQIARALENVGGVLTPYSGRNSFGLSCQIRSRDLPLALQIIADVLQNPVFPEEELQQQKQWQLAALQARSDDVDSYASDLLTQLLYRFYPYRFPPLGTTESVARLTRTQLLNFYEGLLQPQNAVMAIFGDVEPEQTQKLVAKTLGEIKGRGKELAPAAAEPPLTETMEKTFTRPQKQAIVMYGFRCGPVNDPDRYARDVMTAVLAGIGYPGGRLHKTLREAQLVYATFAYHIAGPQMGYYVIYAATAPEKISVVREKIEKIVGELQAEPPSAEELALAKKAAIAHQAVSLESNEARAQTAALNLLYGLGIEEIFRYPEEIDKITAEQVCEQARKILDFSRAVILQIMPTE